MSPTLNVNSTLFVIPLRIIDLQCRNYCHLQSDFSSKFKSSIRIFHHKLLTRGGRVLANAWTHLSCMTIFVQLFIRSVIWKVTIVTLIPYDTKYHIWCSSLTKVILQWNIKPFYNDTSNCKWAGLSGVLLIIEPPCQKAFRHLILKWCIVPTDLPQLQFNAEL